jgi:hypothetical protein
MEEGTIPMRLSEWRANAPHRDAMTPKVLGVIEPLLTALGCDADPHVWVAWGEDPDVRYAVFGPTAPGLVTCNVRVNVPGEGPRAGGKLVRWNRVQLGELGIESHGGHRMVSFQVEQLIIRGADDEADDVAAFALGLFAAVDGRPIPDPGARKSRRRAATAKPKTGSAKTGAAPKKPAGARSAAAQPPSAKSGPGPNEPRQIPATTARSRSRRG